MEVSLVEIYTLLTEVNNTVNSLDVDQSFIDYLALQSDGEINTDTETSLAELKEQLNEITVYNPEAEEVTALTLFFDKLDTIHNDLLQIDACLKIFFVIACIVIFSKIFINTFFKGW